MPRTDVDPEYRRRIRKKAEKDQAQAEAERHEAYYKAKYEQIIAAIIKIKEELRNFNNEQTPEKKSDRFWERFGIMGLWAAAITGLIAIFVANQDSSQQREVMKGQLQEMQAERRPWVSLKYEIARPIEIKGGTVYFFFSQITSNGGDMVARDVVARYSVVPEGQSNVFNTIPQQKRACDEAAEVAAKQDGTRTLFRGDLDNGETSTSVPIHDIEANAWPTPSSAGFLLVGCVAYRLPSGELSGRTGVAYRILRLGPDSHGHAFDTSEGDVPVEQIQMSPDIFHAGYLR